MATTARPSLTLLALEPVRGAYELAKGLWLRRALLQSCPRGDGHSVLILPGLGASDFHTAPLRDFLGQLGYNTLPWGLGFNLGPKKGLEWLLSPLISLLDEVSEQGAAPLSLVGWSLGGVYARELAKLRPAAVRQVITLGSPFTAGIDSGTHAGALYGWLSGQKGAAPELLERIGKRPPVPCTSVFSRTDGVVAWPCSIERNTKTSESIEVAGASHLGLPANPAVQRILADRLAQRPGEWRPYCPAIRPATVRKL